MRQKRPTRGVAPLTLGFASHAQAKSEAHRR